MQLSYTDILIIGGGGAAARAAIEIDSVKSIMYSTMKSLA